MGSKRHVKGSDGQPIHDKWELFVDLPRRAGDLRKRPRLTKTFHGTAKEAERELRRLEREAAAGALSGSHLTVRGMFERYLNEYVANHRAPLAGQFRQDLTGFWQSQARRVRQNRSALRFLLTCAGPPASLPTFQIDPLTA